MIIFDPLFSEFVNCPQIIFFIIKKKIYNKEKKGKTDGKKVKNYTYLLHTPANESRLNQANSYNR